MVHARVSRCHQNQRSTAPDRAGCFYCTSGLVNVPLTPRKPAGVSGAAGNRGDMRVARASCSARTPLTKHERSNKQEFRDCRGPDRAWSHRQSWRHATRPRSRRAARHTPVKPAPQRRPGTRQALSPQSPSERVTGDHRVPGAQAFPYKLKVSQLHGGTGGDGG